MKLNLLISQDPVKEIFKGFAMILPIILLLKGIKPSFLAEFRKLPSLKKLDEDELISGFRELKDCVDKHGSESEFDMMTVLKAVSVSKPEFAAKCMKLIWSVNGFYLVITIFLQKKRTNLKIILLFCSFCI